MVTPIALQPHRGSFFGPEAVQRGGIELLRSMLERRVPDPPVTRLTGLRVTEVGLGTATMAMPATRWWQSAAEGVFLAGALAFVADGSLGSAILTAAPPGSAMTSAGMSLDFIRPATAHSLNLIARSRLLHSTRTQGIAEAYVEDSRGRLLAHGTSRGILFEVKHLSPIAAEQPEDGSPDPYRRTAAGDVLDRAYWKTHSGLDFARSLVAGEVLPPVSRLTGLRCMECTEGTATCSLPCSPWLCNGFGILYGGAIAMAADFAQSSALLTRIPPATAYAPLDFKINYLRPVPPSDSLLLCRAAVVHLGRTIALTTCEVMDREARPVAVANETMVILPGRAWTRPPTPEPPPADEG